MSYKINQEDNHSNDYQNYMKPLRLNSELQAENAALRAKVESLTRQRDLAVSAIENLVKQKGRHNTEIAYKKLVDVLAAIKESEG